MRNLTPFETLRQAIRYGYADMQEGWPLLPLGVRIEQTVVITRITRLEEYLHRLNTAIMRANTLCDDDYQDVLERRFVAAHQALNDTERRMP